MNIYFTTISFRSISRFIFSLISILAIASQLKGQATASVNSTNGYKVNITLTPVSIVAPSSCPWGYNYNTVIKYNITFSGSSIPANLYTLQTYLNCGPKTNFTHLPLNGGSGTTTTTSNPYNSTTDCGTATPASLGCNSFTLIIHGPGIPSQSITMYNSVALPVQYISFTAEKSASRALLKWATASEKSNAYFEVMRSVNGNDWITIKKVEAGKNGAVVQNYMAADEKPVAGLAFYRLKQVDADGTSSLSDITALNFQPELTLSIFPNPASQVISLQGENIDNAEITIMDAMGHVIELHGEYRTGAVSFKTESLANGIYYVNVQMNGVVESRKFSIRH